MHGHFITTISIGCSTEISSTILSRCTNELQDTNSPVRGIHFLDHVPIIGDCWL